MNLMEIRLIQVKCFPGYRNWYRLGNYTLLQLLSSSSVSTKLEVWGFPLLVNRRKMTDGKTDRHGATLNAASYGGSHNKWVLPRVRSITFWPMNILKEANCTRHDKPRCQLPRWQSETVMRRRSVSQRVHPRQFRYSTILKYLIQDGAKWIIYYPWILCCTELCFGLHTCLCLLAR